METKLGRRSACLGTVAALCITFSGPLDANDQPSRASLIEQTGRASANVTEAVTIRTPSVAVRANPERSSEKYGPVAQTATSGQYGFVDENGALVSPPPGGTASLSPIPATRTTATPYKSATDPNATFLDTRNIRAVTFGQVNAEGRVELRCRQNSEIPHANCEEHPNASGSTVPDPATSSDSLTEVK